MNTYFPRPKVELGATQTGEAQAVGCHPINRKVMGSILDQGTYLCVGRSTKTVVLG